METFQEKRPYPTEFRIGNLVDKSGKVHAITVDDLRDLTGIKYIRLTEEWLLAFGWREIDPRRWTLKGFFGFELQKTMYGSETFQAARYFDSEKHYIVKMHVRFVHELQNLYYALEDAELKVVDN